MPSRGAGLAGGEMVEVRASLPTLDTRRDQQAVKDHDLLWMGSIE